MVTFRYVKSVLFTAFTAVILLTSCSSYTPRKIQAVTLQAFAIDSTSIRAIQIVNDTTLWYAGSAGAYGNIINNTITKYRIKDEFNHLGVTYPHFRSIAHHGTTVFATTIENPALIFQLNTPSPKVTYQEVHPKAFYDTMVFFDAQYGMVFGDPTANCPSVVLTENGGASWYKVHCKDLPKIADGEAAFAASNTNIAIVGNEAWLVSGGKKARVFYTPDRGKHWSVYDTPIIQGTPTTGIYTVAFHDRNHGIIFGGDYTNKTANRANKAVTKDGGKTWQLVADGDTPGYISCVQYVPNTHGMELFAVSTEGIYFSNDRGHHWKKVSEEGFYSIRIHDRHTAWLSGNAKIAKMIF